MADPRVIGKLAHRHGLSFQDCQSDPSLSIELRGPQARPQFDAGFSEAAEEARQRAIDEIKDFTGIASIEHRGNGGQGG